jgi:MFS transporter, ACS family, D-galactonate transporter
MNNRPTRARLLILVLLFVGTLINYLDRTVLSIAAPPMREELHLDAAVMGVVFSAFSWTYALAQIPGGVLIDRIGVRLAYFLSVSLWSAFTLLQGFTTGLASLLGYRLGLGVAEAPAYPCNSRVLNTWFPQSERARATGVYSVGQYAGLAFLSPLMFWVVATLGWRMLFIGAGVAGLLFAVVWWMTYRDPSQSRRINQAELDYLASGGAISAPAQPIAFSWANIRFLLRQRQVLGASIGQFTSNSTLVFFLTWFPTYLATERHMGWIKVGFFAVMPYIAAALGVLAGGALSDLLLKRSGSANVARKLPIVAGLLLASTIVTANFVDDDGLVIAVMSVAFFGQGMCNLGWTLISDVAPRELIGLTAGLFNLCANVAGVLTPMVIGFIVAYTGSFYWALAYIATLAALGVLSYVFVVGDVKRVVFTPPAG